MGNENRSPVNSGSGNWALQSGFLIMTCEHPALATVNIVNDLTWSDCETYFS